MDIDSEESLLCKSKSGLTAVGDCGYCLLVHWFQRMTQSELFTLLTPFGTPIDAVISFDAKLDPGLEIEYLDLIRRRADRPDGVVRVESSTVAYVLRGGAGQIDSQRIAEMRLRLAQRDDSPFLVVVSDGRLEVYGIALDRLSANAALLDTVLADEERAPTTFRRLHQEPARGEHAKTQAIHELLYQLLTRAIDGIVQHEISRPDAIALTGRALFVRFLVDRGVVGGKNRGPSVVCSDELVKAWDGVFSSVDRCRKTNHWIDTTFNGDFLPVSSSAYAKLSSTACELLRSIVRRGKQTHFDLNPVINGLHAPLEWNELDFAHIPVGVLSQVYEHQAERWDPEGRVRDSVYYTPRRIAEYMVREAFAHLEARSGKSPGSVRVLDPAVGGGVFLVAAYREIVAARRRQNGKRLSSRDLRRILFDQLAGFDIQDAALSLTSLSLYLTAIELDEPPYRLDELRFERPLRNRVLFSLGVSIPDQDGALPGSLGSGIPDGHEQRYDVVIGNPPWTSLKGKSGDRVIRDAENLIRPLVVERLGKARAAAFVIPDKVPDLPFVWRAMQWARAGGVLAFALHARLLFKTTPKGVAARNDLFDAVTVWGILNGSDIRLTPVWPKVSDPFCLLFADNEVSTPNSVFYMASPYFEKALNESGRLRIDPDGAQPLSTERLKESPYLLKALFRGTALDLDVLERLRVHPRFEDYWESVLKLKKGDGFQKLQSGHKGQDATALLGYPFLGTNDQIAVEIIADRLARFSEQKVHRLRDPGIYQGPLLLLREAIKVSSRVADVISVDRAHICAKNLVFTESFYGFSAAKHPKGAELVRYLCLIFHSSLFEWFHLVTSGKFGVEREVWYLEDINNFPVFPFEQLTPKQIDEMNDLFTQLSDRRLSRSSLDAWTIGLYGLGIRAAELIADTLRMNLPHQENRNHAGGVPEKEMVEAFAARLSERLSPFIRTPVYLVPSKAGDPYRVLVLGEPRPTSVELAGMQLVLDTADKLASSECIVLDNQERIWIARLAQRRYWTLSRARMTAARLLHEYGAKLEHTS